MSTFVQAAKNANTGTATTITATPSVAFTNGNTVFVTTSCVDTATTCTVKDNNNVSYTAVDTVDDAANGVIMFTFRSPTGGVTGSPTSLTATFGASTSFLDIMAIEWSGVDVSASPLDGHNMAAKATTTTPVSNSITTTVNGDAIIGSVVADSGPSGAITAGSGYTKRNDNAATVDAGDETQVQGTAGAITAGFTLANNVTTIIQITAFKNASSAAVSIPNTTGPPLFLRKYKQSPFLSQQPTSVPTTPATVIEASGTQIIRVRHRLIF